MRRWIALLLIALLPLQVSWSIAAEYGSHGATLAAPHAELHVHGHAHEGTAAVEVGSAVADEATSHTACCDLHQCHTHGSFAALTGTAHFAPIAATACYADEPAGRVRSLEATRIERPKWAASPIPC
jgi:hypothetical protein